MALPAEALSVRQPWAWAIIHAGKDIENRSWKRWKRDWKHRGRTAIHAAMGMTQEEYEDAAGWMRHALGIECPAPHLLVRGGIIGTVNIVDNVWTHPSPWFQGPGGLVLREAEPILPISSKGELGIFKWKPGGDLREPARWMLPKPEAML